MRAVSARMLAVGVQKYDVLEESQVKKFNIIVNGSSYAVEVEEVGGAAAPAPRAAAPAPAAASAPAAAPAPAPAAAPAPVAKAAGAGEHSINAPMPGKILKVLVTEGQAVKAGENLMMLEAMKMQNNIEAEKDGKVTAIAVKVGQAVLEDDPLVVIE